MQSIEAERTVTATTVDVLGATQLRVVPGPGAIGIYLASTVADSTAVVSVGGKVMKQSSVISKVATNALIDVEGDSGLDIQVRGGEVVSVDVTVVSAATIRVKAIWFGQL